MGKKSLFTTVTPLPPSVSRANAVHFLHSHLDMIDLNPTFTSRHPIPTPPHARPEESSCAWYRLTDKAEYLPGGRRATSITYTGAFHDLPDGLQTHCYAPMGVCIRSKWTVAGSATGMGERAQPVEIGIGAPASGLYVRTDVEVECNILLARWIMKTTRKSHAAVLERLKERAEKLGTIDIPNSPVQQWSPCSSPVRPYTTQSTRPVSHQYQGAVAWSAYNNMYAPPTPSSLGPGHRWLAHSQSCSSLASGIVDSPTTAIPEEVPEELEGSKYTPQQYHKGSPYPMPQRRHAAELA